MTPTSLMKPVCMLANRQPCMCGSVVIVRIESGVGSEICMAAAYPRLMSGKAFEALLISIRATSARYSGESLFRISSTLCPSSALGGLGGPFVNGVPPPSLSGGIAFRLLCEDWMRASAAGTAAITSFAFANCSDLLICQFKNSCLASVSLWLKRC